MTTVYVWKLNDLVFRHIGRMARRGQRVRGSHIKSLCALTLREMQFAIPETVTGDLANVRR
jgi:hypothetical protein